MKTCKVDNCISPVFSHLYCGRHQYLRTDRKPKKIAPRTSKEKVHEISFGFEDQMTMFWHLWENKQDEKGNIHCPYTGAKLTKYSPFYICHFAHILNKKNYPYFKLNPENVEIVDIEFHRIVDQGTLKERAEHPTWKWDLWDARVIVMKAEYIAFKKKNLLA